MPSASNLKSITLQNFNLKPSLVGADCNRNLYSNNNNISPHQLEQQPSLINIRPGPDKSQAQLAWLGYQQELYRDWNFWSSLSLSTLNIGTVPGAFFGLMTSITWGGSCVQFWGYMLGMFVMLCLSGVIAEIASAFPIAGAMMTWTFKLARSNPRLRDWARFLSWTIGAMLFFAHVVIQVALTSQCTSIVMSTISKLHHHVIIQPGWQTFLMNSAYLVVCGTLLCSTWIRSPRLWLYAGCFAIFLFITIAVSLLTFSNSRVKFPKFLNDFENHTDFYSNVFVFFMGSSLISLAFGAEASIHLSEETCEPSKNVPKALFGSTLLSYILGLFINVCISATLPPLKGVPLSKIRLVDLIFAHCPRPAAILIMICLIILMIFQDIAQLFAASRFTWAMARENVFPGSKIWRKVSGPERMPRMAVVLLVGCCIVTAASIDIKDTIFSHSVITSATYLVVVCYLAPLLIYLTCEKDVLEYDGRNVWRIRWLSRPCAWISVFALTCVLILMAFPTGLPITSDNWSWSPLILISLTIISTFTWVSYGSDRYVGPIRSITFWSTGQELDIPIRKFPTPNPPPILSTIAPVPREESQGHQEVDINNCFLTNSNSNKRNSNNRQMVWPINVTTTTITEICGTESSDESIAEKIEDSKP
ncbi:amino acid permease-domain-containing protein [Phakopsora pachyrhizi]|nr:amino acid permease-domain-containing protein [Phakopsora pachyrhizi]